MSKPRLKPGGNGQKWDGNNGGKLAEKGWKPRIKSTRNVRNLPVLLWGLRSVALLRCWFSEHYSPFCTFRTDARKALFAAWFRTDQELSAMLTSLPHSPMIWSNSETGDQRVSSIRSMIPVIKTIGWPEQEWPLCAT